MHETRSVHDLMNRKKSNLFLNWVNVIEDVSVILSKKHKNTTGNLIHWLKYDSLSTVEKSYPSILKSSSNRSSYIFMLVQKVKHSVYKVYVFS